MKIFKTAVVMTVVSILGIGVSHAAVRPASLFRDCMVVQQQQPIPVWGFADAGEAITVKFLGQEVTTQADAQGKWKLELAPVVATANQKATTMIITGSDASNEVTEVVIREVLVGEVWLCSGQSNMSRPVMSSLNPDEEQASANFPEIRLFTVAERSSPLPQDTCDGVWQICSPKSVGVFSGVGYFFARKLHQELGIPVGMIHASVGGTAIDTWTPLETLKATKAANERAVAFEKERDLYLSETNKYNQVIEEGQKQREKAMAEYDARVFAEDVGNKEKWATGNPGTGEWKPVDMPFPVNALGTFCGSAWCRHDVTLESDWVGQELRLNFGPVDEADEVYVNGTLVGETHDNSLWQTARHYTIPATLVTNTQLTIVVRIMNQVGAMGVGGSPGDFSLQRVDDSKAKVPLALGWTYAMGSPLSFRDRPFISAPNVPGVGIHPSTLYNAMIAPLAPYAVKGALWYQGESDAGGWAAYTELLPAMIQSWRSRWNQPSFPFLLVQIANFNSPQTDPIEFNSYADIRDVQRKALSIPETGLAVALDTGNADGDGHPANKQDVGLRLAHWALGKTYGRADVYPSGPLYRSLSIDSNQAVVAFDYIGSGLTMHGESLASFAIAGADKVFHRAQAEIKGDTVVVWSDKVSEPKAVRYAWGTNPTCSLYNKEGLPASSFRSDDWEHVTCWK